MSIPVQFLNFKAAGVYRIVYDKSTVLNQDAEILRLVVGYSEVGPFNAPTYVKNAQDFKTLYGDISRKLEKRGIFFHRIALQCLASGPILCLNLKRFDDSHVVKASAIDTTFSKGVSAADSHVKTANFPVKSIYDTTKFWELSAEKLTELDFDGDPKRYINISATDAVKHSASYFIRKASGNKVSGYNITVADWYKSTGEDIPEYLDKDKYLNKKISDFFAEIYLFSGEFNKEQVLASDALKNYFEIRGTGDNASLVLKPFVVNAFGDNVDSLDALLTEETSGAIAHYVGCVIPYFKDKMGVYQSLDIIFNNDIDNHHLMMNLNADLLDSNLDDVEDNDVNIDLSGTDVIFGKNEGEAAANIESLFNGSFHTTLLGNSYAPVIVDRIENDGEGNIKTTLCNGNGKYDHVYESSVSFIEAGQYTTTSTTAPFVYKVAATETSYVADHLWNSIMSKGDAILANDKVIYVQDVYTENDIEGELAYYCVSLTGQARTYTAANDTKYIIRVDHALNQEVGVMKPEYLKGYDYGEAGKPAGPDMMSKLNWHNKILDVLADTGIRTGLLNKSEIDYRYIIDTFEAYVEGGCKKRLTMLAKEKQSAFAILNFPSVRTFIKCPYASFVNDKNVFNVQYIVDGCNKKKASSVKFSLPAEIDGASFGAFYSPLKFSDGYIDSIIPSAGLVSNLFIYKYTSRQPYYIIAGPNYGAINAAGLIGPDYHYSKDELNIIEPFGINCMVYRPGFGTFINANQTAKQTPKSALSSINVRELVIYLQDEIEKVLQSYQWEFNNQTVRNAIKDRADAICERIKGNGGIQAYLNIMDSSNNTPDIIDNEMTVLSTHIEPGRGMGKMIHELTIYRTGQMSSSISE